MAAPHPGTARNDLAVYDGRTLLGFLRGSVAGCTAYTADGRTLGAFADQRAAKAALIALIARAPGKAVLS